MFGESYSLLGPYELVGLFFSGFDNLLPKVFQRAMVVSLEEGCEECEEDVRLDQIIRIDPR